MVQRNPCRPHPLGTLSLVSRPSGSQLYGTPYLCTCNSTTAFMTSTRRGKGVRLRWTHVGGVKPHVDVQTEKLKLESTDVILSSSHAKKLAYFFYRNFVFGQKKSENFSAIEISDTNY